MFAVIFVCGNLFLRIAGKNFVPHSKICQKDCLSCPV